MEQKKYKKVVEREPYMMEIALVDSIVSLILLVWSIIIIFSNPHNLSLFLYALFISLYTFILSLIFVFGLKDEIKKRKVYYVEYS